jgi:hypothetical protein
METALDKWLESKQYFTRTKETPIPSHLLYTGYKGGKLYIPRSKEYEFLSQYAAEMARGTKLYFVETRPKTFKFMVDVDITDDHYWSVEEIVKLAVIVQKTIYSFYETDQIMICCISDVKTKNDGIHTGIHFIWPKLFVTSDNALCLRRGIIQKLKEASKEGIFKLTKSWEDIIDEVIYTRNGYRMVGSDKMSAVKGSDKKIIDNRPLKLLFVMDSHPDYQLNEAYFNRLNKDTKSLVLETSIRYVIDTYLDQGMNFNKIPIWLEEDPLQRKAANKGVGGTVVGGKEHILLENFIRKTLPKAYSRQVVKAVTRYPDKNLLIKTNSRFCMNLGREHNSCGIYFFASPNGIYQKCLCPCNKLDGRKNGLCMDYTSECFPFDDDSRKILFPDFNKNLFEEEQEKKKEAWVKQKKKEKQEKIKEERKYVPGTKANMVSQQKKLVDKMFTDIMS